MINSTNLPVVNGAFGPAVATSDLASKKSIVANDVTGAIYIEASGDGVSWCQVLGLSSSLEDKVIEVPCAFMRVDARKGKATNVDAIAEQSLVRSVVIPSPPANGIGASVDISALNRIATVFAGSFTGKGNIVIEASGDGTNWAQVLDSFTVGDGCKSGDVPARFIRARGKGATAVLSVSADDSDGSGTVSNTPLTRFVFRPDDAGPRGNVYTEWTALYAALRSVKDLGRVYLEFDFIFQPNQAFRIPSNVKGVGTAIGGVAPNMTLTNPGGLFNSTMVGETINIDGATTPENNGPSFKITAVSADGNTITYTNENKVFGKGDMIGGVAPNMTLTDAAGLFRPSMVGQKIRIRQATNPANNGLFLITAFGGPTTITYTNPAGVVEGVFPGRWNVNGAQAEAYAGNWALNWIMANVVWTHRSDEFVYFADYCFIDVGFSAGSPAEYFDLMFLEGYGLRLVQDGTVTIPFQTGAGFICTGALVALLTEGVGALPLFKVDSVNFGFALFLVDNPIATVGPTGTSFGGNDAADAPVIDLNGGTFVFDSGNAANNAITDSQGFGTLFVNSNFSQAFAGLSGQQDWELIGMPASVTVTVDVFIRPKYRIKVPTGITVGAPITGVGDSISGPATDTFNFTLTDAAGSFTPSMVGLYVTLAGATTPANDGTFKIVEFISPTEIVYETMDGVAEVFPGTWSVAGYAAIYNELVLVDTLTTAGPTTVQFPTAIRPAGDWIAVKDRSGDAVASPITVIPKAGQTIDLGAPGAGVLINTAFGCKIFVTDGTGNWVITSAS